MKRQSVLTDVTEREGELGWSVKDNWKISCGLRLDMQPIPVEWHEHGRTTYILMCARARLEATKRQQCSRSMITRQMQVLNPGLQRHEEGVNKQTAVRQWWDKVPQNLCHALSLALSPVLTFTSATKRGCDSDGVFNGGLCHLGNYKYDLHCVGWNACMQKLAMSCQKCYMLCCIGAPWACWFPPGRWPCSRTQLKRGIVQLLA